MFITKKEAEKYYIQPYELCPCESGSKYKFCCFEKSKASNKFDEKYTPARIKFEAQKSFRETDFETCFGFNKNECDNIIGAHSLQNNGVLNKIATNNHVYNLEVEYSQNHPSLNFVKVGKNQASKFTGFCKRHDKDYFSCIEDVDFIGSNEQNFWFAFRAFSFENHRKERLKSNFAQIFRKYPHTTKDLQTLVNYKVCLLDLKDKKIEYERFKNIYENHSFEKIETFIKILPYRVGFTGTTAVAVSVDIEGKEAAKIYDYNEEIFIPSLYISVIPKENTSLIIVSRNTDDDCYENLIKSLRETEDELSLLKYISFCLAEYSENVYFSPELVDKLTKTEKDRITSAFISPLSQDPDRRLSTLMKSFSLNLFDLKY